MKFSIDFDGTMWSHMSFFRAFMISMQAAGHQVGVLTGHSQDDRHIKNDIDLMVARGFPKPDFYFGRREEEMPFNGAVRKSAVILLEDIRLHFDDFDFNNVETERIFREQLGDQFYRIVRIQHREPTNVHYE